MRKGTNRAIAKLMTNSDLQPQPPNNWMEQTALRTAAHPDAFRGMMKMHG
jgi:hypothetical protein